MQNQLAAKELFVARYYISVKKWIPAINRLKIITEKYDTTIFIEEALHRLVEIYYYLGLENEAKQYAAILGYNYNSSEWFKKSYKVFNKNYDDYKKKIKKEKKIIYLKELLRSLSNNENKSEIIKLFKKKLNVIKKHNKLYFSEDNPEITDSEYDIIKKEISLLKKKYKFLEKEEASTSVGAPPSNKFKKIKHLLPMLSLSNAFEIKDMYDFQKKIQNFLKFEKKMKFNFFQNQKLMEYLQL